jgi:O-glycosyl hydrolase
MDLQGARSINLSMSRRRFLKYGAVTAASAAGAGFPVRALAASGTPGGSAAALAAVVSPVVAQIMQGFGATGAWWPNDLVKFDSPVRDQVGELLFGKSGIALSVYRYNIGGGGVGVNDPSRAPQTFLTSSGGYDWNRDPGGQLFLQMAARTVPVLIGFVNSAPTPWTTNGLNCGGSLKPGSEWAYGGYLADIAAHFQSQGITLSYLSPMNEPDYTFAGGNQEGMAVPTWQRAVVVQSAGRQLAQRAPNSRLIADESSHVGDQFNPEVPQWMTVPGTAQYVAYLAHHIYDFPSDLALQVARRIGQAYGKTLWCTEICCIDSRTGRFGQQYDPTIAGAMPLANLIWQCLTQANDASFHWWLACSSAMGTDPVVSPGSEKQVNLKGWNDGLLYYAPRYAGIANKEQIYTTKRFYAMGNFSRYVRPGDQRHDVSGGPSNLRILAFSTSAGWSFVVTNNSAAGAPATSFQVQLPPLPWPALTVTDAVETSGTKSLQPGGAPSFNNASRVLSGTVPAQSITTYVLRVTG